MHIKPFLLQYEYQANISMAGHKRTMEQQNDLLVKEQGRLELYYNINYFEK